MATLASFITLALFSTQTSYAYLEGISKVDINIQALINCKIVISPEKTLEKGTILIKDGVIENVGSNIEIPKNAKVFDYKGKTVYSGFIESYLPVKNKKDGEIFYNDASKKAIDVFTKDEKRMEALHKNGFTSALITLDRGIFRGNTSLLSLSNSAINNSIIKDKVAQNMGLDLNEPDNYPSSIMGSIALIRQTFFDSEWYKKTLEVYKENPNQKPLEINKSLEELTKNLNNKNKVLFNADTPLDILRELKIAKEFNLKTIIKGSGKEYTILNNLKELPNPFIIPLNFPEELDVENPYQALEVSLKDLQNWEIAPENPKKLYNNKIHFSFSSYGLDKPEKFLPNLRKAVEKGLPKAYALSALTTEPAKFFEVDNVLGTIEKGKLCHLVVTDGDLFDKKTIIQEVWIDKDRFELLETPKVDFSGKWKVELKDEKIKPEIKKDLSLEIEKKDTTFALGFKVGDKKIAFDKFELVANTFSATMDTKELGYTGIARISGTLEKDTLKAKIILPDLNNIDLIANRVRDLEKEKADKDKKEKPQETTPNEIFLPGGAYNRKELPTQPEYVLIKNGFLWTSAEQGNLANTDILIYKGKIQKIAKNLSAPSNTMIIDATGKHVTAGIVDAHSHTGINGDVNEAAEGVSAEVRIGDVIDSSDTAFYNELAGGVTTANLLHGSANPIGGQNKVVKLKWGSIPDDMLFSQAPEGIKFALGENVKQSNWGDKYVTRYPQTRMGVEQIMRDRFRMALDYEKEFKNYNALPTNIKKITIPPKKDLQLDALLEILQGKRLLHCHSYRQDEILMLTRLAEEFGIKIATFQHVLEGYKVADALAKHGAGASAFSDWWGYKFEVYDAIPYNGAIMAKQGIVVSFNSDSDELARRLNTEATKAIKYGGLSETEAFKFVTINPAKQLKIDKYVGSLEVNKDADFAIWNGSPLSTLSICEQTWIDGRKYFDRTENLELRNTIEKERERIIQKYLNSKLPE